jgi:hypothetical protein
MPGILRRGVRRRRPRGSPDTDGFVLVDLVTEDPRPVLRRIAAEAVILSDEAEDVLRRIRARQGLGFVAPRGGPLVRRFFALRDELPDCREAPELRIRGQLDVILHHHAMLVSLAMDLLAAEWRSERISAQIDALDGMGEPARFLELIYAELAGRSDSSCRATSR